MRLRVRAIAYRYGKIYDIGDFESHTGLAAYVEVRLKDWDYLVLVETYDLETGTILHQTDVAMRVPTGCRKEQPTAMDSLERIESWVQQRLELPVN